MDNSQQTNRQKLVFHLMDKGLSNEEVAQALSDVAEAALEEFTSEAMSIFTEEDKKAIENAQIGVEADELIKKFYQARSDGDADQRLDQLIEDQAKIYMTDSENSTSVSPSAS